MDTSTFNKRWTQTSCQEPVLAQYSNSIRKKYYCVDYEPYPKHRRDTVEEVLEVFVVGCYDTKQTLACTRIHSTVSHQPPAAPTSQYSFKRSSYILAALLPSTPLTFPHSQLQVRSSPFVVLIERLGLHGHYTVHHPSCIPPFQCLRVI